MQDIESDMEDLLRRAAEAYPLKQGEDNWDAIASQIAQKNAVVPLLKQGGLRKRNTLVLLLLVFAAAAIIVGNQFKKPNTTASLKNVEPATINSLPSVKSQKSKSLISLPNATQNNGLPQSSKQEINVTPISRVASIKAFKAISPTHSVNAFDTKRDDIKDIAPANKIAASLIENNNREQSGITKINLLKQDSLSSLSSNEILVYKNELAASQIIALKNRDTVSQYNKQLQTKPKASQRGFYFGVAAGIGLNAIKDQGFKKAGFSAGIIAGYRFNNALSLETGLMFAKKFYWTPGKYFSTKEMYSTMPAGTEITEVHGSSSIVEFPLHVRYDFSTLPHHRFYVVAGLSSYSMLEENNNYYTLLNGVKGTMYGSYKKDRRYFAAAADLAFGYETDFVKSHLRFEPYLQLPVKGIGVGLLPVKTAGLRIAFTRSVH